MNTPVNTSRRNFLRGTAAGAGVTLSLALLPAGRPFAAEETGKSLVPNLFVTLHDSGRLTITCHRSEMGQQIRTSLAQIVADEAEADWSMVDVAQANGDARYGDQNTDGSRSVRRNFTRLRQAGAALRTMLEGAAAKTWQVPMEECIAQLHQVTHTPTGRTISYAQLAPVAAGMSVPDTEALSLKPRDKWRYINQKMASVDLTAMTSGQAEYGQDVHLPDMVYAVIQRPPVMFSYAKTLDDKKCRAIPGVLDVINLPQAQAPAGFNPLGGVAVIARNTWTAIQGHNALSIEWAESPHQSYNSTDYKQALIETAKTPGEVTRQTGNVEQAFAQASNTHEAIYYAPHLAQAPMEPPAATAIVTENSAEIWACTQTPQAMQRTIAGALQMQPEQVTVHVTLLGGGFGRKSKPDFGVEAALLAKQLKKPVKVVWRREDDLRSGYLHTVSAQRIEAAINDAGNVTAWRHNTVFPSISSTFNPAANKPSNGELDLGFTDLPFNIDNLQLMRGEAVGHVRIGWLRSVANVYHAFATQSFADELAQQRKLDSKDNLLDLIGPSRKIDFAAEGTEYGNYGDSYADYPVDTARLRAVIERVATMSDWDNRHSAKRFLGIAAHRSFLSYVATVVEVTIDDSGNWHIPHAYLAIDAGTVVNPEHVHAQCEGGMIYGLSCALGQLTAKNGAIEQSNFHDYHVARLPQAPRECHIEIVPSEALPGGVGEPPTPPFAPALANAIFAATGKRIRELPIPTKV